MSTEIHKGKNKHKEHIDNPEDVQVYYLVSLVDYPKHGYVDTLEGVMETLKHMEDGLEGESIVVTTHLLTAFEFDNLPEFTGF